MNSTISSVIVLGLNNIKLYIIIRRYTIKIHMAREVCMLFRARLTRFCFVLLCLALTLNCAAASELLSHDDLTRLKPAFETLVAQLADTLVANGLLLESDKNDWIDFQIADYLLNAGYGTIAILYSPDTLQQATDEELALRVTKQSGTLTLRLDTLRATEQNNIIGHGLPLDASLIDESGDIVPCLFHWSVNSGRVEIWDAGSDTTRMFGSSLMSQGELVYFRGYNMLDETTELTLEFIDIDSGTIIDTISIDIVSDGQVLRASYDEER